MPAVDQANALRSAIEAQPNVEARALGLVTFYLGERPEATPALEKWAGLTLVRMPDYEIIARLFKERARHYDKKDPATQDELDALRARALRGAVYFGGVVENAEKEWLAKQTDEGADLLALRPDWKYPSRHSH